MARFTGAGELRGAEFVGADLRGARCIGAEEWEHLRYALRDLP